VMSDWLDNFAFHTEMPVAYFLIAGAVTFLIASTTVGFHAVKATRANPVESIKYE
jgi:putative ABC transport system permease protein